MTEKDIDLDDLTSPEKSPSPSDMIQDSSSSPELIFKCKWLGCCILNRILQIQNECRVNRILFQFKNISHVALSRKRNEEAGLSKRALNNLIMGIREEGEVVDQTVIDDFRMAFLDSVNDDFSIKMNNDAELSEILLKLTLNPDIKLKTEALRLLYYLHSQLNITKANIEEVVLLDSTNTKMSYNQSLNITRALCRLVETAEKWYEYPNRPELEVMENILHLIETHLLQENEKKAGFSPYTEVLIEHDESRQVDNEEFGHAEQYYCRELKGTINPFYQNIFRHLGVYKSLQAILKTDFSKFKNSNIRDRFLGNSGITADMSQMRTPEQNPNTKFFSCFSPRHRDLIRRIYTVFALACIENQENKNLFQDLAKGLLFDHLNVDSSNIAMYIFLNEHLTDNFQFVRLDDHQRFLEQIVQIMNSFPTYDIRKVILINTLSNLTRYTGIINQQNQNYMFQKLIRLFNKTSVIDFNNPRNLDVIESKLVQEPTVVKYMNSEVMLQNYEIGYYSAFVKFIRRCGDGRNNLTENTSQILIPLRVIDRLFKIQHTNLDMYDQLLSLFYNIHLNTTKKMPIQFEEITVNIAYKLADQLHKFVSHDQTTLHDLYRMSGIRLEKNDVYCIKYYSKVIECCYKILSQMSTMRIVISPNEQEKFYSDLLEGVFTLYPQISDENHRNVCLHLMIHLMGKTPDSMASETKEKFRQIFKDLEDSVISKGIKAVAENNIKLTTKIIKHSLTIKKFYKHSSKSITMTTFRHKTRVVENLSEQGKLPIEAAFVEYMNMCKEDFFASRDFKRLSESEFHGLVETINNIDSENRKKAKKKNLSKAQDLKSVSGFFNSMVQFLMWETEKIPEELIDILLQIFVDFVKGSNKTAAEEAASQNAQTVIVVAGDPGPGSKQTSSFSSRTSDQTGMSLMTKKSKFDFKPETDKEKDEREQWKSKKLIKYRQTILVDLNVAQLVCQLLTKDVSTEINIKAVKLAITVLDGGNHQAQEKFYEYFKTDPRNKVLTAIQELLDLNLEVVVNYMVGKNNKKLENILQEGDVKMNALSFAAAVTREMNAQKERESEESMSNIKSSIRLIKDVLRFLQLLCEGHYLDMQNYLRDQKYENPSLNRDFVSFGAKMLSTFVKINNKMSLELGIQLLDFLVELVQGPCIANQAQLINIKVVDICKDLLDDISMKNSFKEIWDLDNNANQALISIVSKTTTLLASIMEGNNEVAYIKSIANGLNLEFLEDSLQSYLKTFATSKSPRFENNLPRFVTRYKSFADREFFDEKIIDALQMFIFVKRLKDFLSRNEPKTAAFDNPNKKTNLAVEGVSYGEEFEGSSVRQNLSPQERRDQKAMMQFYMENIRMVEIVFQGSIQQVYFPIHPACRYLPGHKRDEFIKAFNRESPNEKMVQFMRRIPEWFDIMDYMITIKTARIKITDTTFKIIRNITLILSLGINLFYVFYSKLTVEHSDWRIEVTLHGYEHYMLAAMLIHLLCCVLTMLIWLIVYGPIVQMDYWREKIKEIKKAVDVHPDQSEENEICKILMSKSIFEQTFLEKVKILSYYQSIIGKSFKTISGLDLISAFAYRTVMSPDFRYFMSFILFSVLGLGFDKPFFYAIQLWEVVDKFDTLKNVIKAFTHHKEQIITTLLLCLIIVHIFTSFAYYYVNETFYNYSIGAQGENLCVDVLHCLSTVFSLGPRSSGSVGDMLIRQSYSDENLDLYMVRFFWDVLVFLIVNIIFLNMIMGVIIDTFAELRDEKNSTDQKKRNECFLCSISRGSLDKEAEGFEEHTRNVHFLWDYLYFVYYLKMKSVTEYNGMEMNVHEKIQAGDISWLPIQRTLAIERKLGRKVLPEKNVENLEGEIDRVIQGTLAMR